MSDGVQSRNAEILQKVLMFPRIGQCMYIYVPVAYLLKVKLSAKLLLLYDICNNEFYAIKQIGAYNYKPI